MKPYLLQKAERYAKKHSKSFLLKIAKFGVDIRQEQSFQLCKDLHEEYKVKWCHFNEILNFGYLFQDNNELYNDLRFKIKYISDEDDFRNIFRHDLGKIYKQVFGNTPTKTSLLQKVDDVNEKVFSLHQCVIDRIKYHFWCKKHHVKYNVQSHEFEILVIIFMYNRIVDIQLLLNSFRDKYLLFKDNIQKERQAKQLEFDERENRLDDLSDLSSKSLTAPFEDVQKHVTRIDYLNVVVVIFWQFNCTIKYIYIT